MAATPSGWALRTMPTTDARSTTRPRCGPCWRTTGPVWAPWSTDLRGAPIDSGHHMAEDTPDQLAVELTTFLDPALVTP